MQSQEYLSIITGELTTWLREAVAALPNLVVALAVMALFIVLARFARRLACRVMKKTTDSRALTDLVASFFRFTVIACGFFLALGVLGLQKIVFSLLAGAGIAGLAIGFAFQDLAANFISGLLIAVQHPFRIGDVIKCGDYMGTIRKIHLRNSMIETFSGQMVVMPNRNLFENPLINYSKTGSRRIDLEVGVGYDSHLEQVTKVAREAIEKLGFLRKDKPVQVAAKEFGGSSINFDVRYWLDYPDGEVGYVDAVHRGVLALKAAFDEADIDIPYPIRTLDFSMTEEPAATRALRGEMREAS